jgi:TolB-like protein
LQALHARGLVHRDVKPSNVFLTPAGVKLLDFGLARSVAALPADATATDLTQAGALVGTPHYMAPEQLRGLPLDARTDVFAAGALLFEMLAGRKAFEGRTLFEVTHAVLHEQPPVLSGSPAIAALDRAVRKALSKPAAERHASAEVLAGELIAARALEDSGTQARAQALTRLIVLAFRLLRPDPEIDFLGFSLPDAITASLSGLGSLLLRSSLAAARYAAETPDLQRLAREADVDVVLVGTLLRAGDRLRVSTQLVEAPGGTVICSHQAQAAMGDTFQLEDELVRRIVEALAVPLSARDAHRLGHEAVGPQAYELFLRANRLSLDPLSWEEALALDPQVRTSVNYTHFMDGRHELAAASSLDDDAFMHAYALSALGRQDEAAALYADLERKTPVHLQRLFRSQRLALEGHAAPALELTREVLAWFRDPEGIYRQARFLARLGLLPETLDLLECVLAAGFVSPAALESETWFGPELRAQPRFELLLTEARRRAAEAEAAFAAAGGPSLLGL